MPEALEAPDPSTSVQDIALSEMEILEASGPIRKVVDPILDGDTQRISLPLPAEAFRPPPRLEPRPPRSEAAVPTVSIFDRRGAPRWTAPANLVDAVRGAASAASGASVLGWRTTSAAPGTRPSTLERAVELFDRGLKLRIEGRYGEALDSWEKALALAPENHLYQTHVRRLRDQLQTLRAQQG